MRAQFLKMLAALAIVFTGLSAGAQTPPPMFTTPVVDVTKFGVVPNDYSKASANSTAIAAIIAGTVGDLNTTATGTAKTLYFPGGEFGSYYFNRPIWIDQNNITIKGDGVNFTSIGSNSDYPIIIAGMPKNPAGHVLTLNNFVDATSLNLGLPGKPYGVKTLQNTTFVSPGTCASFGPQVGGWASVKQLHISFYIDFGSTVFGGPVCGISMQDAPKPFKITRTGNGFLVKFACQDGIKRAFIVATPNPTGLIKFDCQIDLATRQITGWINDIQVNILDAGLGDFATNPTALAFIQNDYLHFRIGGEGQGLEVSDVEWCKDASGNYLVGVFPDITMYAFNLHNGLRYKNSGVGQPLTRIDGQTESANGRWFSGSDMLFSYYPVIDPNDVIANRILPFQSEGGSGGQGLLWLDSATSDIWNGTLTGLNVQDISINGMTGHGPCIIWGHLLHANFKRLAIDRGSTAITTMNFGANYPIKITDCLLGGYQAALCLNTSIAILDTIDINRVGRAPFRFVGSNVSMSNIFVRGDGSPEDLIHIHSGNDGGKYTVRNFTSDFENGLYPSVSNVTIQAHYWNAPSYLTSLLIEDFHSFVAPGAVGIFLDDNGPATNSGHIGALFTYRNLDISNVVSKQPVIKKNGVLWTVNGLIETPNAVNWLVGPNQPLQALPTNPVAGP